MNVISEMTFRLRDQVAANMQEVEFLILIHLRVTLKFLKTMLYQNDVLCLELVPVLVLLEARHSDVVTTMVQDVTVMTDLGP